MEGAPEVLSYWEEVGYAAIGVALSVLMPFLAALVKRFWPGTSISSTTDVVKVLVPYLVLGAFSVVVALLVAAAADFRSPALALLAGFAWDKTLQVAKLTGEENM